MHLYYAKHNGGVCGTYGTCNLTLGYLLLLSSRMVGERCGERLKFLRFPREELTPYEGTEAEIL
jgi:hypothetical protein